MESYFAPSDRTSSGDIRKTHALISELPYIREIFDSVPHVMALLNRNRQIVYANVALKKMMGTDTLEALLGLRPGEAIGCIHAGEEAGGCGTSKHCRFCGAVKTILKSQQTGKPEQSEVHLSLNLRNLNIALELDMTATPFVYKEEVFTIIALHDISSRKRRTMMERIFFHDIINKLGSLKGYLELLDEETQDPEKKHLTGIMRDLGDEVIEEIQSQHRIILAENRALPVKVEQVNVPVLIRSVAQHMQQHPSAYSRKVVFNCSDPDFYINTDRLLLKRVLINLIKNALEAIEDGRSVTISCVDSGYYCEISVHNPGYIPEEIQLQLFQRSFSTKGEDRGLGTYSVKLLTEEYLRGKVLFESDQKNGTFFKVFLNVKYPEGRPAGK